MEIVIAQIHHGNIQTQTKVLMGNRGSTDGHVAKDSPRYLRNLTNSTELLDVIDVAESEEHGFTPPSHNSTPKTEESSVNHLPNHNISIKNDENDSKENRACTVIEKVEDLEINNLNEPTPECECPPQIAEFPQVMEQDPVDHCEESVKEPSEPHINAIRKSLKRVSVAALHTDRDLRNLCKSMKLKINKPPCKKYLKNYVHAAHGPGIFCPRRNKHPDSDDSDAEGGLEYEVEAIRDYSFEKGEHWYLVKWKNWPEETNTWEPKRNLKGSIEMLEEYHEELKRKKNEVVETDYHNPVMKKRKIESCISEVCTKSSEDLATLLKLRGFTASEFSFKKKNISKLKQEVKQMFIASSDTIRKKNFKKLLESEATAFGEEGFIDFVEKRKSVLTSLKEWEVELNNRHYNNNNFTIVVENHVDLEGPPTDFTYITNYIPGEGITIPEDPLIGCSCTDCFANKDSCCAAGAGVEYAYDKNGLVNVASGSPIYECNKLCSCGDGCPNRVVQKGQQINVLIFRTDDGRGWGVKTLEKIKKGMFVMEYNGEVITNEEAERRGMLYDGEGRTYLFDLDYDESDPLTVDAAFYGNAAHFINHSCDPNLYVYGVWIDHLDTRIPRVAFFARRNIKKYEELTFDYRMTTGGTQTPKKTAVGGSPSKEFSICNDDYLRTASSSRRKPIACRCGTAKCRKFLF